MCGTGTATGAGTVTEPDGSVEPISSYTIVFAAGIGVLVGSGDTAAAVVDITPSQNGVGTPPNCVTQFDVLVAGAIA